MLFKPKGNMSSFSRIKPKRNDAETSVGPNNAFHLNRNAAILRGEEREQFAARYDHIVSGVPLSPEQPSDADTRGFRLVRFGHDFRSVNVYASPDLSVARRVRMSVFSGPPGKENKSEEKKPKTSPPAATTPTKGRERQAECGQKCGGKELGSVECELDLATGMPTDKVAKEVRDKDPCTATCVDKHETIHVKDMEPVCKKVHKCLKEAGNNVKKQDTCLDAYEKEAWAKITGAAGTECAAYTAEEQCMQAREAAPECKSKEGRSRWSDHMARTRCYRDCYCKK